MSGKLFIFSSNLRTVNPKDIQLNLSKYRKEKRYSDNDDIYVYYDKKIGIVFTILKDEIVMIEFQASSKDYKLMCDEEKAKKLSSTKSIFEDKLKDRRSIISCYFGETDVTEVNIGFDRIKDNCKSNLRKLEICSGENNIIEISTIVTNPANDTIIYHYIVTGGKITGQGEKVLWDLSGVKLGTYSITAASDDGCGFCGKTVTKKVKVKECKDCKK